MGRRGFSLTELLVAIVIVCVVAAIVVPVILRTREKAKQTNCMTTQRQIFLALMQYSSENNGYPYCTRRWAANNVHWVVPLLPYMDVEGAGAFVCRSADPAQYELTAVQPPGFPITYGVNEYLLAGPVEPQSLPNPTQLAVLGDSGCPWSGPGATSGSRVLWPASSYFGVIIHNRGAIFTFMDGHAAWLEATVVKGKGRGYTGTYEGAYKGAQIYQLPARRVPLNK